MGIAAFRHSPLHRLHLLPSPTGLLPAAHHRKRTAAQVPLARPTRLNVGSIPLVQGRLLSRPAIFGLTLAVLLIFLVLLSGTDQMADVAVRLTPFADERRLSEADEGVRKAMQASLPPEQPLAREVNAIGQRLVSAIPGGTPFAYRFHVLPGSDVNAFCRARWRTCSSTKGIIQLAGSRERVAAVLAHEIQHVEQRHGLRSLYRSAGRMAMFSMVLGLFGDQSAGLLTQLSGLKHSRELETEADLRGLKLLHSAGYPREAMVTMLETLALQGNSAPTWLSSHPDSAQRARAVAAAPLP